MDPHDSHKSKDGVKVKRTERQRIMENIRRKEFVPIKILLLLVMSSVGVMIPYMTIHMKSLGITVEETAIIYGIFPLFSIMAPPFMGLAADKIGNFKVLFSIMLALCGLHGVLFLAVPQARRTIPYPAKIDMGISCFGTNAIQGLALRPVDPIEDCDTIDDSITNLTLTIQQCGYICYSNESAPSSRYTNTDAETFTSDDAIILGESLFLQDDWSLDVSCGKNADASDSCALIRTKSSEKRNITLYNVRQKKDVYISDAFDYADENHARVQCGAYDSITPVEISSQSNSTLEIPSKRRLCRSECLVKVDRSSLCSNAARVEVYDPQLTFWLYLILRVTFKISIGGAAVLLDGAVLALIMRYDGDLGIQRLFGVIGLMVFSPISGFLIDYASQGLPMPDFRPAFFMYSAMVFCGAALGLVLELDFKPPTEKLLKDVRSVLKNVELDIFFIVTLLSGTFWGYIESYLFWFLEDMGANKSLMGLTLTVSGLSGIPMLMFASPIIRKLGHPNVQVIGFLFYVVRLFGYSYIHDPYMCLVFEALEAFTTALMTTSAVSYSAELSSTTTLTSVQGIVSGIYYGVGRGAGSLIGGYLMKSIGTRSTFRILGMAALGTAIFYFLFNILYLHCRRRSQHKKKKTKATEYPLSETNSAFTADASVDLPQACAESVLEQSEATTATDEEEMDRTNSAASLGV